MSFNLLRNIEDIVTFGEMEGAHSGRASVVLFHLNVIPFPLQCMFICPIVLNPLTSRPGCIPGSRYTGVGVLFFVI